MASICIIITMLVLELLQSSSNYKDYIYFSWNYVDANCQLFGKAELTHLDRHSLIVTGADWQLTEDWQLLEHQFIAVFSINNSWFDCYLTFQESIRLICTLFDANNVHLQYINLHYFRTTQISDTKNEGCLQEIYVIWSKNLLEFVRYGLWNFH